MKLDITKANKWKLPKASYTNWKKEAPNSGSNCWKSWFEFQRLWSGRMWYITCRHHQILIDFRVCPWSDIVFPTATKKEREAVKEASKFL